MNEAEDRLYFAVLEMRLSENMAAITPSDHLRAHYRRRAAYFRPAVEAARVSTDPRILEIYNLGMQAPVLQ